MRDKNYARMILLRGREKEKQGGDGRAVTTMRKKRDKMGRGKEGGGS